MQGREGAHVGLAIVRAVVEQGSPPVVRVVRMDDLFRDEHVLGVTSSPEEAAAMIHEWLVHVIERATSSAVPHNGPVTQA